MTDSQRQRGGRRPTPPADRFHPKVDRRGPDDCWPWLGGTSNGYGSFRIAIGHTVSAHGYAKELATGIACPPGMNPRHTCVGPGSKLCCNPDHVVYDRPGTATADPGYVSPHQKLTDAQVREARRRAWEGERVIDLAAEYGVCQQHMSHIKHGHSRANA